VLSVRSFSGKSFELWTIGSVEEDVFMPVAATHDVVNGSRNWTLGLRGMTNDYAIKERSGKRNTTIPLTDPWATPDRKVW
jgi:hypothetical protein